MKFQQILNRIKAYAQENPLVHSVSLGDIYENLNGKMDIIYSNVNIDISSSTRNDNMIRYQVYLYYTDRLLENKSNWENIKDTAETVLHSIINYASEALGDVDDNYTITYFEQQFADYCAGGWVNFILEVPNEIGHCTMDDYITAENELYQRLIDYINELQDENVELAKLLKEILYKLTGEVIQ